MITRYYGDQTPIMLKQSNGVIKITPQTFGSLNWSTIILNNNDYKNVAEQHALPTTIAAFKQFSSAHPTFFYIDLACNIYFTIELVLN